MEHQLNKNGGTKIIEGGCMLFCHRLLVFSFFFGFIYTIEIIKREFSPSRSWCSYIHVPLIDLGAVNEGSGSPVNRWWGAIYMSSFCGWISISLEKYLKCCY